MLTIYETHLTVKPFKQRFVFDLSLSAFLTKQFVTDLKKHLDFIAAHGF